jgi:hypothetical protein
MLDDGTMQKVSRTRRHIFEPETNPMPGRKLQSSSGHSYRIYPPPGDSILVVVRQGSNVQPLVLEA